MMFPHPSWQLPRKLFLAVLFAVLFSANTTVFANVDDAARLVYQIGTQTIATLRDPGLTADQRQARFRALLTRGFDLALIGRFALTDYWSVATPDQQRTYLALFGEYLLQTYSARLGEYASETITVTGARQASDKDVVVNTLIGAPGGQTHAADWRVRSTAGRYRIIDIVIDNISLAITHRSEFAAVIRRHGFDGLLTVLRDHTAPN
jgi:phospholipid transport system substrate-binding protein